MNKKAIVLLSGGQDSTTCLYWAKNYFTEVHAIGFLYGQKHAVEQERAMKIANDAQIDFKIFDLRGKNLLSGSSLTDNSIDHNSSHAQDSSLPASFTAGRNALFLTIAASYGYNLGIHDIVTGVCQTDESGYPDCRRAFINSMEETLTLGTGKSYAIHTPLMRLSKAETWKMANDLGIAYGAKNEETTVLDVIINDTMTDYNGDKTMNEWGMGIDNNPATHLREKGYFEAKEKGWLTNLKTV